MSTTDPATHHLTTDAQTSTSGNYEADLAKIKADLAILLKIELGQLGLSTSRNHLYQHPYSDAFDLIRYPTGRRIPNFVKFSGDDNKSTWEHIS